MVITFGMSQGACPTGDVVGVGTGVGAGVGAAVVGLGVGVGTLLMHCPGEVGKVPMLEQVAGHWH
jgi:hypothetical protein